MAESLARQHARTRRFTLGVPRAFTVSPDGRRVAFLRSRDGNDPVTCLWTLDVVGGRERLVADPAVLLSAEADEPTAEELVHRERARELSTGITGYSTDQAVTAAVFALSGRVWRADLDTGEVRELPAVRPAVDPRLSPGGSAVAYVSGGALHVGEGALARPEGPDVTYGLPEHVAAEEMRRHRGFWWAPDETRVLVARVDTARVRRWYIADPADPAKPPREFAYPAAGTANADVTLWIADLAGNRIQVDWDRVAFEYVVAARWDGDEPVIVVQSRDQRVLRVLMVDPTTGATRVHHEETDAHWVELAPGTPAFTDSDRFVWVGDVAGARRLSIDGEPVTPDGLNVDQVCGVDGETVLFAASREPTEVGLWTFDPDGGITPVADEPGVHAGWLAGGTTVVDAQALDHDGHRVTVYRGGDAVAAIASRAERPVLTPVVMLPDAGAAAGIRTAVLFPTGHVPGSARLPVLMDPYGGPAVRRVLAARNGYLTSQWLADQGFAVVVVDGRGTPGRGPQWDRSIYGDLVGPVLDDQITALQAAAERYGDLDLSRVAIRGWSFGGYLAALAVLRRPDVFHAAVAGAPPTDHRLYDTYWKERFLGRPDEEPENYERCDLTRMAPALRRPLMLIHGLADDNVVAAHTLRLSAALLAAGRPHTVLPLPGATHMLADPAVAENVLLFQVDFIKRALRE